MKRLTRKEVVELRKQAIAKIVIPDGVWNIEEGLKLAAMAEATIEADEKAGVLMLVDSDNSNNVKEGDIVKLYHNGKLQYVNHSHQELKGGVDEIIQRNNIPVYQTRKETNMQKELKKMIKNAKYHEKDWVSSARDYISAGDYHEACRTLVAAELQRFLAQELETLIKVK